MAELKTKENEADVLEFINSFADSEQKKIDSYEILKLMKDFTGFEPKMWGGTIIGFGKYHYKSHRSVQEGDWFLVGFSPRKAAISLYVYTGGDSQDELLKRLGKYKMGKSCIYIKRLSDVNINILKELVVSSVSFLQAKYK